VTTGVSRGALYALKLIPTFLATLECDAVILGH